MRSAGLVDLQVNGFGGVDFNDAGLTAAGLDRALEAMLATGVTTALPTIITADPASLKARFAALDTAVHDSRLGREMCPGYHLEGPFLNPEMGYRGCHPHAAMTPPDYALVEALEAILRRPILMVTLAPELPGGIDFIARARRAGKLVAIGHSAADFTVVGQAAAAGAGFSTHLGNGLPQMLPKLANTIFAQLSEDALAAGFIADGIHLPPRSLKAMIRAKGPDRAFLVTDAVAAAAMPPGLYPFAGMTVERMPDGSVRIPGTTLLAGSGLCLDQAVRNLVEWGFARPEEAVGLASTVPAGLLAPALAAHGIAVGAGDVEWGEGLVVRDVRLG